MTFQQAIRAGFTNYVNFEGLASRSEYWYWALFSFIVSTIANGIDRLSGGMDGPAFIGGIAGLALLLPSVSVAVRRLRDAGYPWTYLLLLLIPFLGAIVVIVLLCQPGKLAVPTLRAKPAI
ncbi:MAG: rane protein YhaH [Glaciihabitans sp.]|nr:rane protein YhaH [Glaciihabitans sp.]